MVQRTTRPVVPYTHPDEVEHRRLLAIRASASLPKDGTEGMSAPLGLSKYLTGVLPDPTLTKGAIVFDDTLGLPAASDGAAWNPLATAGSVAAVAADLATLEALLGYSTGTWTPAYGTDGVAFTSVTYDPTTGGRYTKIGNLVHIQATIMTDAVTKGGATGNIQISGLPFAAVANTGSTEDGYASIVIGGASAWLSVRPIATRIGSGATSMFLFGRATVGGDQVNTLVADVATGANSNFLRIGGTYIA